MVFGSIKSMQIHRLKYPAEQWNLPCAFIVIYAVGIEAQHHCKLDLCHAYLLSMDNQRPAHIMDIPP